MDYSDLFISSTAIRKLIIERLKTYDISVLLFCEKLSIPYATFNDWMAAKFVDNTDYKRINFTQDDLLKVCKELGVDVRIRLIVNEDFTPDVNIKNGSALFNKDKLARIINSTTQIDL
jgi:hypothetical protein